MKKLMIFLFLFWMIVPTELSAASYRQTNPEQKTKYFPVDSKISGISMTIEGFTYKSGNNLVPAEVQGEVNVNPDSQTGQNINDITLSPNNTEKPVDTTTGETEKTSSNQVTDSKGITYFNTKKTSVTKKSIAKPIEKIPTPEAPVQSSLPVVNSQLKFETIFYNISVWWLSNPFDLQIWYLFFLAGLVLYLFKLRQLRRPLLFSSIIILGFYLGSSLDPIGSIFNNSPRNHLILGGSFIFLGVVILFSLFLGRFFCGWICPLGAVQEFIHPEMTTKMLPQAMDTLLKYIKYIVLIVFFYLSWQTGDNLWNHYEPLKVLVHFNGSSIALLILTLTIFVSLLIERPFCRYVCPLGAIFSLISHLTPFKMRSDATACMVCGKCTGGDCPMNAIDALNPVIDLPKVDGSECIYCLQCQKICQRAALRVSIKRIDHVKSL